MVLVRDDPAPVGTLAQAHGQPKIKRFALTVLVRSHAMPDGGDKGDSLPVVISTSVK
jgi:hypothetical protein